MTKTHKNSLRFISLCIIALLLAICLATVLVACGEKPGENNNSTSNNQNSSSGSGNDDDPPSIDEVPLAPFNYNISGTNVTVYSLKDKTVTEITVPDSVTSFDRDAFDGCDDLESITVDENNQHYASEDGILYNKEKTEIVYVPIAIQGPVTVPGSVTSVGAFSYRNKLTSVVISEGVTSIDYLAFYMCWELTSISIPDSVTSIDGTAITNCGKLQYTEYENAYYLGNDNNPYVWLVNAKSTNITSCSVHEDTKIIKKYAFQGCTKLMNLIVPLGNTKYNSGAGSNCIIETESKTLIAGCQTSVIPADGSVTSIGDGAFYKCSTLTTLAIPSGVTSIGEWAFNECSGLTSVNIPNGVTSIGSYAFRVCTSLTSITIPDSVTSIGFNAFGGCYGLTSITIPYVGREKDGTDYTKFGSIFGAGSSDSNSSYVPHSLRNVTITGGASIDSNAFLGCSELTSITISGGVTSIGESAFSGCTSLTSITISDSVTSINNNAFDGCSRLTSITFNGAKAQWLAISKGSNWNANMSNYIIHCSDGNLDKNGYEI